MEKYVEIYYDKVNQTQRFVLAGANDCTSSINRKLTEMKIPFTNNKFIGKYEPLKDFKNKTYKYAKKWRWLSTIHLV